LILQLIIIISLSIKIMVFSFKCIICNFFFSNFISTLNSVFSHLQFRITHREHNWIKFTKFVFQKVSFTRTLLVHWIQILSSTAQDGEEGKRLHQAPSFSTSYNLENSRTTVTLPLCYEQQKIKTLFREE